MKHLFITNVRVITPTAVLSHHCIEIQQDKIKAVFPQDKLSTYPKDAQIIDGQNAYAAPGLIDTHIHGFGGFGAELGTAEALLSMSEKLAQSGVTSFCPTLYAGRPEEMLRLITNTVAAFGQEKGAHLLGYHLEGPFLSPEKPGVMRPQDISPINIPLLKQLYAAAQGHIVSITAAPELPHIDKLVAFCRQHHILLQAGHTNATYEQFLHAVHLGITHTTHLFNAMSPLHHRQPRAVGAVLTHPEISAEIIADGVHVHPDLVAFLHRVKPLKNIVLVTDALLPTEQTKGPFIANREEVILKDGAWKRKSDGVLAGSALTMLQGVKNLVSWGYTLPQAIACASTHPARLLGLPHKGTLAVGMDADIVLFDEQFYVKHTFLA